MMNWIILRAIQARSTLKRLTQVKLTQAIICLVCLGLGGWELNAAAPPEFSGGYITGPLFQFADWGCLLFLFGFLVAFNFPNISSIASMLDSLLCFPIFSYLLFPGYVTKMLHVQS